MRRGLAFALACGSAALALLACNAFLAIDDVPGPPGASADASPPAPTRDATLDAADAALPPLDAIASDASADDAGPSVDADPCAAFDSDTCSVLTQCGCGPNLECTFDPQHADGPVCIPSGPAVEHEVCPPDCIASLQCIDGMCHQRCDVLDAACPNDPFPSICTAADQFNFCAFDCDLADAAACGDASFAGVGPVACSYLHPGITDCTFRFEQSPCNIPEDCPPAKTCLGNGACAWWCILGAGVGCPGGTTCQSLASSVFANGHSYGACQ